jgi:hypothetical protein
MSTSPQRRLLHFLQRRVRTQCRCTRVAPSPQAVRLPAVATAHPTQRAPLRALVLLLQFRAALRPLRAPAWRSSPCHRASQRQGADWTGARRAAPGARPVRPPDSLIHEGIEGNVELARLSGRLGGRHARTTT